MSLEVTVVVPEGALSAPRVPPKSSWTSSRTTGSRPTRWMRKISRRERRMA